MQGRKRSMVTHMNKVHCDKGCQEEFTLHTHVEKLPDNEERHYMQCPTCGQQYTSHYLDDHMKKLQGDIKNLQGKQPLKDKQKNRLSNLQKRMWNTGQYLRGKHGG